MHTMSMAVSMMCVHVCATSIRSRLRSCRLSLSPSRSPAEFRTHMHTLIVEQLNYVCGGYMLCVVGGVFCLCLYCFELVLCLPVSLVCPSMFTLMLIDV